jgi:beta-glucanase (GH16 family)
LHQNSSGDGGVPDAMNSNNRHDTNTPLVGYWHNYGLLWTPNQLTWYVDEIPIMSLPPYASTNQPTQLILTAGAGGVNGSPSKTNPPIIKVDWVRVWQ